MFRDIDLISTCVEDKRLMVSKVNSLMNQATDPTLRALLQDMARTHQWHIDLLNSAQHRTAITQPAVTTYGTTYASPYQY